MTHLIQFMYFPHGEVWYRGATWSNVFVVLPLAILGFFYIRSRHLAVIAAHEELKLAHVQHSAKLDRLLAHMDPDTPGPITDVLDRLDPGSPGGIAVLDMKLDALAKDRPSG